MASNKVYLLPNSHPDSSIWSQIINRQKDLRLLSLRLSPNSFSSTYAREVNFTEHDWKGRLQNPAANTFIAIGPSEGEIEGSHGDHLLTGTWVGMVVLVGPFGRFDERKRAERYFDFELCGMFVLPYAQGTGFGKALVTSAVDHAKILGHEHEVKEISITLSVSVGNIQAMSLYQRMGFVVVNGDPDVDEVTMKLRITLGEV
jgi:GNAT superfamily N-acetyltransferase